MSSPAPTVRTNHACSQATLLMLGTHRHTRARVLRNFRGWTYRTLCDGGFPLQKLQDLLPRSECLLYLRRSRHQSAISEQTHPQGCASVVRPRDHNKGFFVMETPDTRSTNTAESKKQRTVNISAAALALSHKPNRRQTLHLSMLWVIQPSRTTHTGFGQR